MHFFDYKTRILKLKGVELGQLRDGGGGWGERGLHRSSGR